jgi:hypothetical protein
MAPLDLRCARAVTALQDLTLALEPAERDVDVGAAN